MTYQNIFIFVSCLYTLVTALPLNTANEQDEKVAVFVPYDIKYVPVEVPDSYVQTLLSKSREETPTPVILDKEDILRQVQKEQLNDNLGAKDDLSKKLESVQETEKNLLKKNVDGVIVVPHTSIAEALRIKTVPKSEDLKILTVNPDISKNDELVVLPIKDTASLTEQENDDKSAEPSSESHLAELPKNKNLESIPSKPHSLSKRQAPGYFFYRPIYRYTRISTHRRKSHRPSRKHALVGYMSDRDLFPTVA